VYGAVVGEVIPRPPGSLQTAARASLTKNAGTILSREQNASDLLGKQYHSHGTEKSDQPQCRVGTKRRRIRVAKQCRQAFGPRYTDPGAQSRRRSGRRLNILNNYCMRANPVKTIFGISDSICSTGRGHAGQFCRSPCSTRCQRSRNHT